MRRSNGHGHCRGIYENGHTIPTHFSTAFWGTVTVTDSPWYEWPRASPTTPSPPPNPPLILILRARHSPQQLFPRGGWPAASPTPLQLSLLKTYVYTLWQQVCTCKHSGSTSLSCQSLIVSCFFFMHKVVNFFYTFLLQVGPMVTVKVMGYLF